MTTATYCHVPATAENSAVVGGLGGLAPLGAASPPSTTPARTSTATAAKELPKTKFATKQAKNREENRLRKLAKHHRSGAKHSAETIERIRATRLAQEQERKAAQLAVSRPAVVQSKAEESRQFYRDTVAERRPILAERQAKALAAAKKTCDDAEARLHELRHRGRPRTVNRPPPLSLRKHSDEVLLATLPQWQGER